jgi:hypothetical protein
MRQLSVFLGLLLANAAGSQLMAGTTQCSDPLSAIQYYYSTPDGGAPRPPIEHWTIQGQQYYPASCETDEWSPCPADPEHRVLATFEKERPLWQKQHGTPGEGNAFFERVYTVKAKVTSAVAGKVLAHTYLICKQNYHNGLPIP